MTKVKKPKTVTTMKDHINFLESRLETIEITLKIKTEAQLDSDSNYSKLA